MQCDFIFLHQYLERKQIADLICFVRPVQCNEKSTFKNISAHNIQFHAVYEIAIELAKYNWKNMSFSVSDRTSG